MAANERSIWESIYHAIDQSKTLTVRTFTYLPHERTHVDRILAAFLAAVDMSLLGNNLSYCIHELAGNAKKANTKVCVRNNVVFTSAEQVRIHEKLAIAKSFSCLADAYTRTEDGAEGAGLGIVMMLFMLRNLGFDQDVFTIRTSGNETVATLTLKRPQSVGAPEPETTATA